MTPKDSLAGTIGRIAIGPDNVSRETITIRTDLRPGDFGAIIALHGLVYTTEFDFKSTFEPFVAQTIAEFALDNGGRGRIWLAEASGGLIGCAALVDRNEGNTTAGQVRWVVVHPVARGLGLGKKLMDLALAYAREQGHARLFLETTDGLDASKALYERLGFQTANEVERDLWGERRIVVTMTKNL